MRAMVSSAGLKFSHIKILTNIFQGNKCDLVWEGETAAAFFDTMIFKVATTEALAREFFRDRKCEHYWDLAHSKATITKTD